jgi:hypothetical protein
VAADQSLTSSRLAQIRVPFVLQFLFINLLFSWFRQRHKFLFCFSFVTALAEMELNRKLKIGFRYNKLKIKTCQENSMLINKKRSKEC